MRTKCYEVTLRNNKINHIYSIPVKAEGYDLMDTLSIITDKCSISDPDAELVSITPLTTNEYINANLPNI